MALLLAPPLHTIETQEMKIIIIRLDKTRLTPWTRENHTCEMELLLRYSLISELLDKSELHKFSPVNFITPTGPL